MTDTKPAPRDDPPPDTGSPYTPPFVLPPDDTSANLPVDGAAYVPPVTGDEPTGTPTRRG